MSDLATFRKMLRVDRNTLDDDLEVQAEVLDRISQQVNRLGQRLAEAKEKLSSTEARLTRDVAEDATTKMTATQVSAEVHRHRDRRDAWAAHQSARFEFEEWEALRDAWRQRGYSLKTLSDLYAAQYFTTSSHQARDRSESGISRRGHQRGHEASEPSHTLAEDEVSSTRHRRRLQKEH